MSCVFGESGDGSRVRGRSHTAPCMCLMTSVALLAADPISPPGPGDIWTSGHLDSSDQSGGLKRRDPLTNCTHTHIRHFVVGLAD